ncbi:uncharacterized protein V1510DRAFT_413399 [Dipodascopsis tothii]|uniref:uncharacterized protein n=1 Tax=Dipodascopsis tothii TaxID=44089 RepID=UPI0034CEF921
MAPAGHQQTLNKFFSRDGNTKAPKQQVSLKRALSGGKSSKSDDPAEPAAEESTMSGRKKAKRIEMSDSEDETAIKQETDKARPRSPRSPRSPEKPKTPVKARSPLKAAAGSPARTGLAERGAKVKTEPVETTSAVSTSSEPIVKAEPETEATVEPELSAEPVKPASSTAAKAKPPSATKTEDDEAAEESDSDSDEAETEAVGEIAIATEKPAWADQPLPYSALCATFDKVSATTKRLEIIAICSKFLAEVMAYAPDSLLQVVYLFINRLCPDYEGVEIGIGEGLIIKAISESTGRSLAQIKADYRKTGDLGTVAQESRSTQPTMFRPKPLVVKDVFKNLKSIATMSGNQSQSRKIGVINKMLSACTDNEAKFLVRSLEGKLRIRLAEKTLLTSLAHAAVVHEAGGRPVEAGAAARAEEMLKTVYSEIPSYDLIVPALQAGGVMHLSETCTVTPGVPLKPMLAKPTKAITEILDRFQDARFTCEYKYDGERAQVHYVGDGEQPRVWVYSRNSEDMSSKYPDIVAAAARFIKPSVQSFILDSEAVAWDRQERRLLPFQVLSTRKRKDVQEGDIKVRVCVFGFDLLYLNGESLLQRPLAERRRLLRESFDEVDGEFTFAKHMDGQSVDEIQEFLDQSVKDACEGLMVKALADDESLYEPSKRSRNWLKLKKDYLEGMGDSLDLVVLGAYYGRGKRTNWYGAFLLGCYNTDTQEYETICKIGTGFSEENLAELYGTLSQSVIAEPKKYYAHAASAAPDVWFEPVMVWEVLSADLSLSPVYRAAINELGKDKGVSLRFPRFIRVRDDKGPEDATTAEDVAEFYNRQSVIDG